MSPWRSSTFSIPTASIVSRPSAIGPAARSTPSAEIPGEAVAIAIRLPPAPHPISSTRAVAGSGVESPCSAATVASRSGCVCA